MAQKNNNISLRNYLRKTGDQSRTQEHVELEELEELEEPEEPEEPEERGNVEEIILRLQKQNSRHVIAGLHFPLPPCFLL